LSIYKDISYTLVRSHRRKTASIYVERDGSVTVRVPDNLGDAEIEALIEGKRYWIHKYVTEWRELNAAQVAREYVNGEGFLYLGRSYRLQWIDDQAVPLQLKGGYFLLRRDPTTQMGPEEAFKAFYREQGSKKIPERVARYAPACGIQMPEVHIMDLGHRWGSANAAAVEGKGRLNFHWRCMMAPLTALDYIVVHELTHLLVPDHSPAFWSELDKIMPDYRERQRWLRDHGAGMDL
jgi:predicted metal-dependent hydrolase